MSWVAVNGPFQMETRKRTKDRIMRHFVRGGLKERGKDSIIKEKCLIRELEPSPAGEEDIAGLLLMKAKMIERAVKTTETKSNEKRAVTRGKKWVINHLEKGSISTMKGY